ncbi:hypothetical protein KSF78_0008842 [Schistosoma japonicum]|nr:hypothetical protein KSF78_0008838 [Schistosoma japonicum]KAH8858210.1 hypothetical protein KSF78_0008840 [Schistosoma japonicum]KAH8858218.1 hypothetical protein KSF78_0008842 [Schistosoma japonicum]
MSIKIKMDAQIKQEK